MSERTIGRTSNVPVEGKSDTLEALGERGKSTSRVEVGEINVGASSVDSLSEVRVLGSLRTVVDKGHVGKLAVVGGAHRILRPHVQGIADAVVAGLLRNGVGEVVRSDPHVVVGTHGVPGSVLVPELGERVGISALTRVTSTRGLNGLTSSVVKSERGLSGVVGALATEDTAGKETEGHVLSHVEERNNGVGEPEVEGLGVHVGKDGRRSSLVLSDQNITSSITHLVTLILVDDGVVSKGLSPGKRRSGSTDGVSTSPDNNVTDGGGGVSTRGSGTREDNDELIEVAEDVVDLDVVERKSSSGERNTRVLSEEERERDHAGSSITNRVAERRTSKSISITTKRSHGGNVTDHVVITSLLGSGHLVLTDHIEVVVIELLHDELIEGDLALLDKIVHKIPAPSNTGSGPPRVTNGRLETNAGDGGAEPRVKNVVTGPVDRGRDVLGAEIGGSRHVTKRHGNEGEPVRLLDGRNEKGHRSRATIKERLELGVSSKIDEGCGRSSSSSSSSRHFIYMKRK